MIDHSHGKLFRMESGTGSIVIGTGGKDSNRKEDCQIHEYHQEIAFGYG